MSNRAYTWGIIPPGVEEKASREEIQEVCDGKWQSRNVWISGTKQNTSSIGVLQIYKREKCDFIFSDDYKALNCW